MLRLIADSGSTKTIWVLLYNGVETERVETRGINPYVLSTSDIILLLQQDLPSSIINSGCTEIYFYGAGCSTPTRNAEVHAALSSIYKGATIEIDHDLLGAARGLLGNSKGIACILGTGSNSCVFDGKNITDNIPSLGYILGDEGSGGHIGRSILTAYMYNELPVSLKVKMEMELKVTKENILENIYKKPLPNKYMASFSKFAGENISHDYIRALVKNCFTIFIEKHILPYKNSGSMEVAFVGSVAYIYKELLLESLNEAHLMPGKIISNPIEGLISYHS